MDVRRTGKARRLVAVCVCLLVAVSGLIGVTSATAPPAQALPSGFQDNEIWSGLLVPTEVAFAPGGQVFVAEKGGTVKRFDSLTDTTPSDVADLRTNTFNWADRGLLGLAVDPNFSAARPYIYVQYTYDHILGSASAAPRWGIPGDDFDNCGSPPGDDGCVVSGRISKLTLSGVNGTMTNEQVLVEDWCQQYPSHSIGTIIFGTDGKLYGAGGDGASFNAVDYGQGGGTIPNTTNPVTPKNPCGDPPVPIGGNQVPSTSKGGALRSQAPAPGVTARESTTGKVSLSGSLIRIDPDTGAGVAGNPWFTKAGADDNEKRIIAYGFRNPFRFSMRGGTNEIWLGDVGWNDWEEINTIPDATTLTAPLNFGWPCYEGAGRQPGYDGTNLQVCENLYGQGAGAVTPPVFAYSHSSEVVQGGDGCGNGGSAMSGTTYYNRPTGPGITPYPANYDGSLFFTDYNRQCIWRMRPGTNGRPDPTQVELFEKTNGGGVVDLVVGPNGDLFYPDINNGAIHRIQYFPTNTPPVARFTATPSFGATPLTVNFNASTSTDVDGGTLTYAWDLDGDGQYDDANGVTTSRIYSAAGNVTVGVRVSDPQGASGTASTVISPGNTPPTATITTPSSGLTWKVGDHISFSGSGFDTEDGGNMPASRLSWLVSLLTCDANGANCVTRRSDPYTGLGGETIAPDWSGEGNNVLEFRLTATDSTGLTNVKTVRLNPQQVTMSYQSSPPGLQLTVASETKTAPFSRTVIVGSVNSLSAPSPVLLAGKTYQFTSWSDGGAATHTVTAPSSATTYTATYTEIPNPGLVAAYGFEAGSGPAISDSSVFGNNGTTNAAWNTTGKFGNSLTYNGTSSLVTVPDNSTLDLSTGATVEAWVNPTVADGAWRTIVMKENPAVGDFSYALEANTPYGGAGGWNVIGTTTRAAENPAKLPLNTWTHAAMTYDGANIRYYQNGALVATVPATGSMTNGNGGLQIGGNSIWGEFFAGRIDEVRVYNRALSAAEIVSDRDAPIASDTVAPSAPGTLTATGALGRVNLSWGAATDNIGVAGYDVHRSTTAGFTPSVANRIAQPPGTTYGDVVAAGTYYYRVIARDGAGNVGPASNQASGTAAADTPPSAPGTVSATGSLGRVTLAWNAATDDVGVARYDVFRGTTAGFTPTVANRIAQPTTPGYIDNVAAGTYYYRVIAVDTAGQSGPPSNEASGTATADTTAPTVSITAPANNATVSGTVSVAANASDNVAVAGVQFKVDGVNVGAEDTVAPYSASWDSRTVSNGAHSISAVARDAQGNTTTTAINVTVANTAATGLVGSYGFEAGSGTTIADSSGTGNNGTASATAWNTTGKFGNSLTYNGTSSLVTVPDSSSLDLTTGATLEAWLYPTAVGTAWRVGVMKENPAVNDFSYGLEANTPYGGAGGWNVIGTTTRAAENPARLPVDTWTHAAMTFDGSNIRYYENGTLVATTPASGSMVNGNGPLRFGGTTIWANEFFAGRIDEVRVYNRALSAAEIVSDRDAPIASDTVAPSAPGTLTATGALGRVNLSWGAATDNIGVAGYDVHRSTTAGFTPSVANRIAQPPGTTYGDVVAAGTYYYRVIARDGAGNVGPASNQASGTAAADTPPSAPGTVSATGSLGRVTLAWNAATDDVGVARYDVFRSTTAGFTPAVANRIAQPTTPGYIDNVAAGTYYYRVIAVDTAGQSGPPSNEASGTATADTTAPTVSITAPANNATVSGTVSVAANASDNVAVAGVQFKVDGVNVGAEDTVAPYSASWDSRTVSNGAHSISAVARDASTNSSTTSINVTVSNTAATGLVAAYSFNATSGTAVADSSGNALNGVAWNTTWNTTGKVGNSLTFNGTSGFVTVADNAKLDLTTGATVEAWVYATVADGAWRTIAMKENPAVGDLSYALEANTPYGGAGGWNVIGTTTRAAENPAKLPLNTWTHAAMTYDGANIRYYQNGALISTVPATGSMTNGNGGFTIGGNTIWGEYFAGRIDEMRVYNRALSAAEIVVDRDTAVP